MPTIAGGVFIEVTVFPKIKVFKTNADELSDVCKTDIAVSRWHEV